MSGGTRWAALASAAAVLLALLAATPAAHGADGEVEVRVAAQRLADGRTEFALQERGTDGTWEERRLPRGRFFPADTRVGRWLGSSPLTITTQPDGMTAATPDGGLEVRVAAQLLADGRMEFALQERESNGSWGERRLPRGRFFPADTRVGRWLGSSPLTVSVPGAPTLTNPTAPETSCVLTDTAKRVEAATFQVQTTSGFGTAFYIGNGEWITNHHVVDTVSSASLVHGDTRLTATVAGSLPGYDLALLGAQPPTAVGALGFASVRPLLASSVSVSGFPSGVRNTPSLTGGIVSKHAPFSEFAPLDGEGVVLQTDAEINSGNSGGPIVDDCGAVVGVATFKQASTPDGRDVDGIGFGIAAETVTAQLPHLRSATHDAGTSPTAPSTLEIIAFCNVGPDEGGRETADACRAAAAAGLHADELWSIWVIGVDDWDSARYSLDGTAAVTEAELTLEGLAPGEHTVQIIEQQAAGWTEWSQPYRFEIRDRVATLVITAFCNGDLDTAADCLTAATSGLVADERLSTWVSGVEDFDNVRYSIDGWPGVTWADLTLGDLAPGPHTLEVIERQSSGWTEWSVPYTFTVRGVPAWLEIATFCTGNWDTDAACRAAAANGLDADENWQVWVSGVEDFDNVYYSLNGGDAVAHADMTLLGLVPGRHTIQAIEQQAAGWTGWSEPYWFTIRE